MQQWVIKAAVMFILRKLLKHGDKIDWGKVQADLALEIARWVPGTILDQFFIDIGNAIVQSCAHVLKDVKRIEQIANLLLDGKWNEAVQVLKDLILGSWIPSDKAGHAFIAALADKPTLLNV